MRKIFTSEAKVIAADQAKNLMEHGHVKYNRGIRNRVTHMLSATHQRFPVDTPITAASEKEAELPVL